MTTTEARARLVCATLQVGERNSIRRFLAQITPATLSTNDSSPTTCVIEVPAVSMLSISDALQARKFVFDSLGPCEDDPTLYAFNIYRGYNTLAQTINELATLIWRTRVDDPRYWFVFSEATVSRADMYVVDVNRSNRRLKVYQNLDPSTADENLPDPFTRAFWDAFKDAAMDSGLCRGRVWFANPHPGQPYLELDLTDEARANFELSLYRLMQLAPHT